MLHADPGPRWQDALKACINAMERDTQAAYLGAGQLLAEACGLDWERLVQQNQPGLIEHHFRCKAPPKLARRVTGIVKVCIFLKEPTCACTLADLHQQTFGQLHGLRCRSLWLMNLADAQVKPEYSRIHQLLSRALLISMGLCTVTQAFAVTPINTIKANFPKAMKLISYVKLHTPGNKLPLATAAALLDLVGLCEHGGMICP